jgi:uncharacterized protein (DUF2345 family)
MHPKPDPAAAEPIETEPHESARVPALLEEIAAAPPADQRVLALASGRVVEARAEGPGEDRVTIKSATGEVELEVRMTPAGPVLRFRAADVELAATRQVSVNCESFHVRAEKEIVEETGGDLRQKIGGSADVKVRRRLTTAAGEARLVAKRGNVQIEANDDVELLGERVKLNC